MAKSKSRPKRWSDAHQKAETVRDQIKELMNGPLATALGELRDIQSEYQDWLDGLPENLSGSFLAEKLDEVCGIELDSVADAPGDDWSTVDSVVEDCGAVDLPRGFGRD